MKSYHIFFVENFYCEIADNTTIGRYRSHRATLFGIMKLGTYHHQQHDHLGVIVDDKVFLPALAEQWPAHLDAVQAIIDAGTSGLAQLEAATKHAPASAWINIDTHALRAPIPRPRKNIICLGWNYAAHAAESAALHGRKAQIPEDPIVFTKAVTTVTAPYADIALDPAISTEFDWEVELGVIIGKAGRHIAQNRALEHVFGYTIINDISARDLQFRHKQYFMGKSVDGTCPVGPYIVTADEIPNPQNLDLSCHINGTTKQYENTRAQIFQVAQIISTLSSVMTLEPGDIISTGTPDGVGFARTPPEFLKPGDLVECRIERIGKIANRIT